MAIGEKLTQVANNVPEVYEAGHDDAIDAMWEAEQAGGTRTNYAELMWYRAWTPETFKPIYSISTTSYDWGFNCPDGYADFVAEHGQVSIPELEKERGITFTLGTNGKNGTRL